MNQGSFLWLSGFVVLLLVLSLVVWRQAGTPPAPGEADLIGGTRDEYGCLGAAGYTYDTQISACIRGFEIAPATRDIVRLAMTELEPEYGLTVVSVRSYDATDSYDVLFERGEERTPLTVYIRDGAVTPMPSHEQAEETAMQFLKDALAVAPPNSNTAVEQRIYGSLSSRAKESVREEAVSADLARFIGIQDVPEAGVSIEDLRTLGAMKAVVRVGLNYSGGQTLRDIHLVIEDMTWKVDAVTIPEPE